MLKNFIDGQFVESLGREKFDVINPATEEVLAHTPLGTKEDVAQAVAAANRAYIDWRATPAVERIQYLFKLKQLMEENLVELSTAITKEHGKTLIESKGSVRRAIQMVETATSIPSLMLGDSSEDIARGIDSTTIKRPMGVFAGIAPFNFPAMVPFWFWPFAVATGNTYVLKASERVPLTSMLIFELLEQIGLPPGVMNLVHGGKEVVDALCVHPQIKGVSFVGSTPVAKHVYQTATSCGKRVQALGGAKNVMVVMPDGMGQQVKEKTVATAVDSVIGCAGERCLAGSILLAVGDETYEKLKEDVVSYALDVRIGDGLDSSTQMGPVISAAAKERIGGLIERSVQEGAKILVDGRQVEQTKGYFMKPSVLAGITQEMEIAQVEVFGPVILLGKVDTLDAAIEWINGMSLANTTTIFSQSGAAVRKFTHQVAPSMIGVNIGVPAPMSFFSFGGSGESFFGDIKAHGRSGVEFFTDPCTTIYRWYSNENVWEAK